MGDVHFADYPQSWHSVQNVEYPPAHRSGDAIQLHHENLDLVSSCVEGGLPVARTAATRLAISSCSFASRGREKSIARIGNC